MTNSPNEMDVSVSQNSLRDPRKLWFAPRAIALFLGAQLDRLNTYHINSVKYGYKRGVEKGREEGKHILELHTSITPSVTGPQIDRELFEDWVFPITVEVEQRFRADVASKLPKHQQPTDAQWKMILSRTPSTSVIAGAGAGKSTTMVLRLLLLNKYLGFPFEHITVVTFTRESRLDVIDKLKKIYKIFGEGREKNITDAQGRSVVRTFHSRILPFVKSLDNMRDVRPFEFLKVDDDTLENIDQTLNIKLNPEQIDLMFKTYEKMYHSNVVFKKLVGELYRQSILQERLDKDSPEAKRRLSALKPMSEKDAAICATVEDLWRKKELWPLPGVSSERRCLVLDGQKFFTNGYIPQIKAHVLLGFDGSEDENIRVEGSEYKLRADLGTKRTIFQVHCKESFVYFHSYADAHLTLENLEGIEKSPPEKFSYKVRGELGAKPILEAFYSAASFIENLGLDVVTAVNGMKMAENEADRQFFHAMALYWVQFENDLSRLNPPVMTFNRMFALFGERKTESYAAVPDEVLRPMSHTMIDEFQDSSPQTMSWIRAVLREIKKRGNVISNGTPAIYSSVMAVGDDYQSIYGWRGSSPKFFMEFDNEFPSPEGAKQRLMLKENFRSHQMIIDAAESLVCSTTNIEGKDGIASNDDVRKNPTPVKLQSFSIKDGNVDCGRLKELVEFHFSQGDSILILYRVRATKDKIIPTLKSVIDRAEQEKKEKERAGDKATLRIKMMTFHASKGLQADAVFVLGDCEIKTSSPYKNKLYNMAGLANGKDPSAFDNAQAEEALRLAYVAITRAIRHCYWFLESSSDSVSIAPAASSKIDASQRYFEDNRVGANHKLPPRRPRPAPIMK